MNDHVCEKLSSCIRHPRWHVMRGFTAWLVWDPRGGDAHRFPTYVEAVYFAADQARASMVAAVQDGAA